MRVEGEQQSIGAARRRNEPNIQEEREGVSADLAQQLRRAVALRHVPLGGIPQLIATLAVTDREARTYEEPMEKTLMETKCPECSGPLWEERHGAIVEYRCLIGHAYSPLALQEAQREAVEKSLWESVIMLENAALLSEKLVPELGPSAARDFGSSKFSLHVGLTEKGDFRAKWAVLR